MMLLRLIMPSSGDMELVAQAGGTIDLAPLFYGKESMGPHVQLVEAETVDGQELKVTKILGRYKLKLKLDGKIELKKGDE